MKATAKFCLLILQVYAFSACSPEVVPFRPVVSTENGFEFESEIETEFYENLKVVLDHYLVEYEIRNQVICVDAREYNDNLELMMNYTMKARDARFLQMVKDQE